MHLRSVVRLVEGLNSSHWKNSIVEILSLLYKFTYFMLLYDPHIFRTRSTLPDCYHTVCWSLVFNIAHWKINGQQLSWWRHQMETFSTLLALCAGNSSVHGEFPAQRPVAQSFDVFFDLRLNKRLSKQSWGWWFETLSCPLWCRCNDHSHATTLCSDRIFRSHQINPHIMWCWFQMLSFT